MAFIAGGLNIEIETLENPKEITIHLVIGKELPQFEMLPVEANRIRAARLRVENALACSGVRLKAALK